MTTPPAEATILTPTTTAGTPDPVYLPEDTVAPTSAATVWPSREECNAALAEARAELPPAMQGYAVTCSHSKHADTSATAGEFATTDATAV